MSVWKGEPTDEEKKAKRDEEARQLRALFEDQWNSNTMGSSIRKCRWKYGLKDYLFCDVKRT